MSHDELEESRGHDEVPRGKLLPLNSRRLTAAYLKYIALSLELPTAGSVDETRVLVEGKLRETHDVANEQVVIDEATTSTTTVNLSLMDDDSVFLKTPPLTKSAKEPDPEEDLLQKLTDAEQKSEELAVELAATLESLDKERAETAHSMRSYVLCLLRVRSVSCRMN